MPIPEMEVGLSRAWSVLAGSDSSAVSLRFWLSEGIAVAALPHSSKDCFGIYLCKLKRCLSHICPVYRCYVSVLDQPKGAEPSHNTIA